ncbi:efflux RND transporter periplasmic adaptor subunit [Candidatus Enterococcus clewellii]|uniref:HlyD family secretion protein n=1 Tax=Candidatus Enterococcus clewellii TaxID=1834193 RepID=A0A242JX49_9ENTE|nr:efflux RND transporter periplasmic adaptor subunit [Enterococcus sp. 9E7_DIV0242]OTP09790.1 hypothetical protein A5888_003986 [Enterococcus sp. 9E7_DIV0242]
MKKRFGERTSKKKKISLALFAAAGVGTAVFLFSTLTKGEAEEGYTLYTVKKADPLILKGKVIPRQLQSIYLEPEHGKISEIPVSNGQEIHAGEAIIQYQNSNIEEELSTQQNQISQFDLAAAQAAQNVNAAQVQYNTIYNQLAENQKKLTTVTPEEKELFTEKRVSLQAELATAEDQLRQAQQAVETAQTQAAGANELLGIQQKKASTVITAPVDGIISINEQGKNSSEVPVIQISSKEKQIQAEVTEYDLDKLAVGQEVEVSTIGTDQKAGGSIAAINSFSEKNVGVPAETNTATYLFTVNGDFNWSNDRTATVQINQQQLIIPESAIVHEKDQEYVFLYHSGKTKKTAITTTIKNGRKIIESGLKEKDKIIEEPDEAVKSDAEIKVINND